MHDTLVISGSMAGEDGGSGLHHENALEIKSDIHVEITPVPMPEVPVAPDDQTDYTPSIPLSEDSIMQTSKTMKTVLATRSTDDVIDDLNRFKPRSKTPATDQKSSIARSEDALEDTSKKDEKKLTQLSCPLADGGEANQDESTESESDDDIPARPSQSETISYEKALLESYVRNRVLGNPKNPKVVDIKDEGKQSVRWLVQNTGAQEIISSPREYQVELFERAKVQNIIAVLDTGSGKTLIAVLLLRHIIDQELERRAIGDHKRISFFLVDSVALVFQQYAVLNCNLNQKMEQFCGEMGCDLWSKELWEKHFNENMVIVCTAEVLFQCLHHSFINMRQINLLIFDEAHHAKRNHPYARIIKDFYASEPDQSLLPRIFGMTASPVDARVNVRKAAAELEALLHCQIVTASDASLLQYSNAKKQEQIAVYSPLPAPYETPLLEMVYQKIGGVKECSKPLTYAKSASSDLGSWAADQVLLISFTEEEVKKLEAKIESKFHKQAQRDLMPLSKLESKIKALREAHEIIMTHHFASPQLSPVQLSSKAMKLADYLRERFERTTDDKCIVFVKQRYTARLLADLFASPDIGTPHLRVGALVRKSHNLHALSFLLIGLLGVLIVASGWHSKW